MAAKPFLFALATLLAVGVAAQAPAQLRELMSTRDGDGTVRFRARTSVGDVDRVAVRLYRNGDAAIEIVSGMRETFRGSWRNDGSRRVRIDIDRVGRDRADGSGTVEHNGRGEFTSVRLDGRVGSARFELDFSTGRSPGGGGGSGSNWDRPIESLNASQRGDGRLDFRTRSSSTNFGLLRVNLGRDHRFEITIGGGGNETFRGRWWHDGNRRIRLDVDRVGWTSATGTGTLDLDTPFSFRKASLNGRVGDAEYRMSFESGRSPSGNDDDDFSSSEARKFRDNARRAVVREFSAGTAFDWDDEKLSEVIFGNRTATGKFRARNGNRPGNYTYRVVMGAGTAEVKSASVNRD